jgi:hypothetical protein
MNLPATKQRQASAHGLCRTNEENQGTLCHAHTKHAPERNTGEVKQSKWHFQRKRLADYSERVRKISSGLAAFNISARFS